MKVAVLLFAIGTIMFAVTMVRQFNILTVSEERDPMLKTKLFFFLFNLFNVLTTVTALCAFYWNDESLLVPSMTFYTVSAMIALWTYYKKPKKPTP